MKKTSATILNSRTEKLSNLIAKHQNNIALHQQSGHTLDSPKFFENRVRCLSIADIASLCGLSTKTIERLAKKGELLGKKVGRRLIFTVAAYESWLNSKGG